MNEWSWHCELCQHSQTEICPRCELHGGVHGVRPQIMIMGRYGVDDCRRMKDTLFAYGDNIARRGKAGQAIIRDEPNAVGIVTKAWPSMEERAFFSDADFNWAKHHIDPSFIRLSIHLQKSGYIVLPKDGFGTGLAQLEIRSPKIFEYIQRWVQYLTVLSLDQQWRRYESRQN
jgi:hypothetical protein